MWKGKKTKEQKTHLTTPLNKFVSLGVLTQVANIEKIFPNYVFVL